MKASLQAEHQVFGFLAGLSLTGLGEPVPPSRRAARLLTSDPTTLRRADCRFVDTVRAVAPAIREVADLINDFRKLLRRQSARSLAAWLEAASATALRSFAQGLAADLDALQAALQEPWSKWPCRGAHQPPEAHQATDVRPRQVRPVPSACLVHHLTSEALAITAALDTSAPNARMNPICTLFHTWEP
ncbi:hypothetical protein [Azospirillum brasilense]|uniref:Uncharacterized protein n=1 Tax=Azospirillum brasilense TaxID=192 RepID=A0A235HAQ8_AZOBR|nr:hypothetical protein [Azospirillum brasilense]OYD82587.1 hypothetical protein CHT98_20575 [Azospirillum brasilense]